MSDLTVYAEALIGTVARAFYDDEAVVVVDVLIRDKFLRDDDMAPRLGIPARRLRQTLQFLQEEHLVATETVDDLAQGGSQATKFYYLDYNRAVHSIRLRVHLLRKKLERSELRARSSSFYLCPGYKLKRCNGRYTEEEAQQVLDASTGLFLCGECSASYANDPSPPPIETYTLQLVDNARELKLAVDQLRRFNVQLSSKSIGNDQLRAGIYDLLQKVRGGASSSSSSSAFAGGQVGGGGGGALPGGPGGTAGRSHLPHHVLTSNLPSENFALGLGSKRLAGTGRTAGIKAKKLEQSGASALLQQQQQQQQGAAGGLESHQLSSSSSFRHPQDVDLLRLTNAMGQKVQFQVERGGGARAQILAGKKRRLLKVLEGAASRVGTHVPLYERAAAMQRDQEAAAAAAAARKKARGGEAAGNGRQSKAPAAPAGDTLEFLRDNIGRGGNGGNGAVVSDSQDEEADAPATVEDDDDASDDLLASSREPVLVLLDEDPEMTEEIRRVAFHPQYKLEMVRQSQLLHLATSDHEKGGGSSPSTTAATAAPSPLPSSSAAGDDESMAWEDGDLF